jgi:hypothetical protein
MTLEGEEGREAWEPHNTPDQTCTRFSDPPYVLGQGSEPIGCRINLLLNLGGLLDMLFSFGWLIFTTCDCRSII